MYTVLFTCIYLDVTCVCVELQQYVYIILGLCVHVLAVCTMHRWIVYNLTEK